MNTLLLSQNVWDLTVDAARNIAVASDPYAPAQDAASACRVFRREQWYDTTLGIPYFEQILGVPPPQFSLLKAHLVQTALTVPEVTSATCFITSFVRRTVGGQIQGTLASGQTFAVVFPALGSPAPWYVTAASPQAAGSTVGGP